MRLQIVRPAAHAPRASFFGCRATGVLAGAVAALVWSQDATAQAFFFAPPLNAGDILSAKFVGNFAGLTAHRFFGTTEVNRIFLDDPDRTLTGTNLSDAFFGTAAFNNATPISLNNMQTGLREATIPAAFYPVILKGRVDLIGVITDTLDAAFAIDCLYLEINTTSRGMFRAFYGSGLDGFLLNPAIPIGGNLPDDVTVALPSNRTGTGFDETISSKAFDVPGPGVAALIGLGLGLTGMRRRRA